MSPTPKPRRGNRNAAKRDPLRSERPAPRRGGVRGASRGAERGGDRVRSDGPRRSAPRGLGGEQVEGRQAVRELLLAGSRRVREVWINADREGDGGPLADLAELAASVRVPVRSVSAGKLASAARSEAPQGVLALCDGLPEHDYDDLLQDRGGVRPFVLALDGVTDPGNLGALLRTAECSGVTGVVLPKHRSVHVTPTATKSAQGAVEYLRFALVGGLPNAIERAKAAGLWVVGLDGGGPTVVGDLDLSDRPVMLVLGAEGKGLSPLVRKRCDVLASIPLKGRLGSLNVAAAGAIACYEVARHRP